VCAAFTEAMRRYGVPAEVLTDNGAQFTGRHTKPQPVEVLFERICRDNGITQRRTKPRSPTTTGKVERFHKTLREEFLDHALPFESLTAAQEAVDGWVASYNHRRPHQALDMATPASRFRPNGPTRLDVSAPVATPEPGAPPASSTLLIDVIEPPAALPPMGLRVLRWSSRSACLPVARSPSCLAASGSRCTRPWPGAPSPPGPTYAVFTSAWTGTWYAPSPLGCGPKTYAT
jgi:hypothetical protein